MREDIPNFDEIVWMLGAATMCAMGLRRQSEVTGNGKSPLRFGDVKEFDIIGA